MHEAIAAAKEATITAQSELQRAHAALLDTLVAYSPWKVGDMIEMPYGVGHVEKGTRVRVSKVTAHLSGTVWADCVYPRENGKWSTATIDVQCEMIFGGHASGWDNEGRFHPHPGDT